MKVGELIKALEPQDKDSLVLVSGYEGDLTATFSVNITSAIKKQEPGSYFGEYEDVKNSLNYIKLYEPEREKDIINVITIER